MPQPSLLLTVYQPLPGCGIRQLFLHHAGHCGRRYRCPKWVNHPDTLSSLLFVESVESEYADFHPCFSFHSLVIDVTMALDTLSLPVLEPLTPGRLLDVTVLALSCLYAGGFIEKSPLVEFRCMQRTSGVFFFLSGVSVATCMAILQVGSGLQLRAASTGSKEEDYENDAATIVQKCVGVISEGGG